MCEDCKAKQEMLRAEISELARGEGAAYDGIMEIAQTLPEGEKREHMLTVAIMKAISVRAALIASLTHPEITDEGGCPPSLILGVWAGWAMNAEMEREMERQATDAMFDGLRLH